MNMQDLYNQLGTLELTQLAFDVNCDGLNERQKQQIYYATQTALSDLYTKFDLKNKNINVMYVDGKTNYKVSKENLNSFMDDSNDPFDDSLIKITSVQGLNGEKVTLNKVGDICTVLTPTIDSIVINNKVRELAPLGLCVTYKAGHVKLDADDAMDCPEDLEFELPDTHNKALIYNVAGRIYSPMGATNEVAMGNEYFAKYLQACEELTNEGIEVYDTESRDPNLFHSKGFR